MNKLYTDAAIRRRFEEYGGIIRHVLPYDATHAIHILPLERGNALVGIDWRRYFANPDIESSQISYFVVKYDVRPPRFDDVSYAFVSEDVKRKAKNYIDQLTTEDQISLLKTYNGGGRSNLVRAAAPSTYENVVANLLVDGVPLMRRPISDGGTEKTLLAPKLAPEIEREIFPIFQDMKMRTLYQRGHYFPFVDLYYKDKIVEEEPEDALITLTRNNGRAGAVQELLVVPNVHLVGIKTCIIGTSSGAKNRQISTFHALKKKLQLPDDLLVDLLFCPNPLIACNAHATLSANMNIPAGTVIDVSILQVEL